jgi:hypothetical protein
MSAKKHKRKPTRHITARGIRREEPDLKQLARVLIELARSKQPQTKNKIPGV